MVVNKNNIGFLYMATDSIKKPLTAMAVSKMKLGDQLIDIGDYEGLRVKRTTRGTSFLYRYKNYKGLMKVIRLGNFPNIKLLDARAKLIELKSLKSSGIDPQEFLEEQKVKAELELKAIQEQEKYRLFTFKSLVDLYLEDKVQDRYSLPDRRGKKKLIRGSRKEKGQQEVRRTLYGDVVRVLGDKSVSDTSLTEVKMMIDQIIVRGSNVQAGNVLRELNLAYRFAISREVLPVDFQNPCPEIKNRIKDSGIKVTNNKRSRVLNENEINQFWHWLISAKYISPNSKNIMFLSLITGMRTGELCKVEWKDINFIDGSIYLKETKNGVSRNVQLSVQAIEFIRGLEKCGNYLFCTRDRSGNVIEKQYDQKQLTQQLYYARTKGENSGLESWSPHDLRRTVRTQLSKLRCPREISEAILGHSKKGIEGTYDLYHYELESKEWLQKWADRLFSIIEG